MKTLLAILCPPLAVLLTGRPFSAALNLLLTLCLYIPGAVHALVLLSQDQRAQQHAQTLHALTGRPHTAPRPELTLALVILATLAVAIAIAALRHDLAAP